MLSCLRLQAIAGCHRRATHCRRASDSALCNTLAADEPRMAFWKSGAGNPLSVPAAARNYDDGYMTPATGRRHRELASRFRVVVSSSCAPSNSMRCALPPMARRRCRSASLPAMWTRQYPRTFAGSAQQAARIHGRQSIGPWWRFLEYREGETSRCAERRCAECSCDEARGRRAQQGLQPRTLRPWPHAQAPARDSHGCGIQFL